MSIVNNTEVMWPVNPAEVYALLGVASGGCYDIATICCSHSDKINPASKVKPIQYAGPGYLTYSQFKGTLTDHANGIYYGLRCAMHDGSGDGTQDDSRGWEGMHLCDWSYVPPVLGTHWMRLTDFALSPSESGTSDVGGIYGYKHNAVFNPLGYIAGVTGAGAQGQLYYDIPENLVCAVAVQTDSDNNLVTNLGVNLQDVAGVTDIGDWYPCILISYLDDDGNITGPHYARALAETGRTATTKYQKLKNTSDAWAGSYVAETYSEEGNGDLVSRSAFPWPTTSCRMIATLFITQDIGGTAAITDLQDWVEVSNSLVTQTAYTVPGGAGIILNFARYYAQGMELTNASAYALKGYVTVSAEWQFIWEDDNKPIADATYTFHVQLYEIVGDVLTPMGSGQQSSMGAMADPDYVSDLGEIQIAQIRIQTTILSSGSSSNTFQLEWWVTSDATGERRLNEGVETVVYTPPQPIG